MVELVYPNHVIHEDFTKHSASNQALSEDIESNSVVSSLSGLDRAFQQLGNMPYNLEQHVKREPNPDPMDV